MRYPENLELVSFEKLKVQLEPNLVYGYNMGGNFLMFMRSKVTYTI